MADDDDTIYIDVVARLDEASADEAAGKLRDKFKDAAAGGEEWIKGLGSKLEDQAKAAAGKLKDVFGSDAFRTGASEYAQGALDHLGDELGDKLGSLLGRGVTNLSNGLGLDLKGVPDKIREISDAVGGLGNAFSGLKSDNLTDKLSSLTQLLGAGSRSLGAGGLADTLDGLTSVLSGVSGLKGLRQGDIEGGLAGLQALIGGTNSLLGNKPGTGILGQAEGILGGAGTGAAVGAGIGSIIPIPGLSTGVGAGIGAGVGGIAALIAQMDQQPQDVPQDVLDALAAQQQSEKDGAIEAIRQQLQLREAGNRLQFEGMLLPGAGLPTTPAAPAPAGGNVAANLAQILGIPTTPIGAAVGPPAGVPSPAPTGPTRAPAATAPTAPAAAAGSATGAVSITATTASISAGSVTLSGSVSLPGIGSTGAAGSLSPAAPRTGGWPRTVGGGGALHYAGGGVVPGPGTIGQDSQLAWLAPGERVLTPEQNSFYNAAQRDNTHNIPGFGVGGEPAAPPPPPPPAPEGEGGPTGAAGVRPPIAAAGAPGSGASSKPGAPPDLGADDPLGPTQRGISGGQRTQDGIQDNSIGYGQGFMPTGTGLIGFAEQAPAMAGMLAASGAGSPGPAAGAGSAAGALAGVAASAWQNLAVPEINEAIQQGVRMGATAIEAPFETFSVGGKSLLSGWPQKLLGGVMGQLQNLPNIAGATQAPLSPQGDDQPQQGDGGAGGLNSGGMPGGPQGTRNDPVHVRTTGDPGQAGAAAFNGMNWVASQSARTP